MSFFWEEFGLVCSVFGGEKDHAYCDTKGE